MRLSRLPRMVLGAAASGIVLAIPLTSTGCGGSGSETQVVAPKQAPTVSAKDSMSEYLKGHQNQGKKSKPGRG